MKIIGLFWRCAPATPPHLAIGLKEVGQGRGREAVARTGCQSESTGEPSSVQSRSRRRLILLVLEMFVMIGLVILLLLVDWFRSPEGCILRFAWFISNRERVVTLAYLVLPATPGTMTAGVGLAPGGVKFASSPGGRCGRKKLAISALPSLSRFWTTLSHL